MVGGNGWVVGGNPVVVGEKVVRLLGHCLLATNIAWEAGARFLAIFSPTDNKVRRNFPSQLIALLIV